MSEIINPPGAWTMYVDKTESQLKSAVGNQRLISIKSYVRNGQRVYCAISVLDKISGLGWTGNMTPQKLRQTVNKDGGRLISLDAFWDTTANEPRCAGVWIKNAPPLTWNFGVDFSAVSLGGQLLEESGKLTCVRVYNRPGASGQPSVERYAAIWIKDDGKPWNWEPDISVPALGLRLDDEKGRLISLDNHTPDTWLPTGEKVAAVWWRNDTGAVWFWNIGLDAPTLKKEFPRFCSYGMDLVPAGPTQFASLMYQFPKPPDPNQATLVSFQGACDATLRKDLWQGLQWTLKETNLTAIGVSYATAMMFSAAEGGWSWWSGNFTTPAGQNILGLPLALAPAESKMATPGGGAVSNNPKVAVFALRAEDGASKHQMWLAQALFSNAGYPKPANLPIQWPIYLGVQGPVECVPLTNGKNWVTVAAQVCNGTAQPLTITSVSVRLRHNNDVLHEASFTSKLTVDLNVLGKGVDPVQVGPVLNSDAPLPKFYDGFAVPAQFTTGQLKVQATVKLAGTLECYGDTRELTVNLAPVTILTRLPYDPPMISATENGPYRWRWGNGVGGTTFNAHSYPEHRYSYDLGVWDKFNKTLKPGGDPLKNEDYHCWNQPIRAMDPGEIWFVDDTHPDNVGNQGNINGNLANVVVIYNKEKDLFYLYVHMIQGSAKDKNGKALVVGNMVSAGDLLGHVGNSGGSSEPHLHVGISRRDKEGFIRSLPMSFTKLKDGGGHTVSGVPVDGAFYS